jgi:hypothetical protein
MKHEIIKTDNYLLVVDNSEIKVGDYTYHHIKGIYTSVVNGGYTNQKKIIAHLPLNNSPIFEGVDLLPPLEQNDNVERLVEEWMIKNKDADDARYTGFIKGYNKTKEKYKYTEEDMMKMFEAAIGLSSFSDTDNNKFQYALQSLSQPKMPIGFECEVEDKPKSLSGLMNADEYHLYKPKTTTNSQGQTVWAGKYIYA